MTQEIWKDIVGYEGVYLVSNLGNVKSLARISQQGNRLRERLLKPYDNGKGYQYVDLYDTNSKKKKFYVHRLVAFAFVPNPNNYPNINHMDCNPYNNKTSNLEWCTQKYNCNYGDHALKQSLSRRGKLVGVDNSNSKRIICVTTGKIFDCIREAADFYGLASSRNAISGCCKGKHKYIGKLADGTPLIWMYYEDYIKIHGEEEKYYIG